MKTEISIESNLFPAYPNEEEEINTGRFGKKLGEYLKLVLEDNGILVADLYPTDYSYEIRIDMYDFPVYVQMGNIEGETNRFLVFIEPQKEFVRKWFRKIPTKEIVSKIYTLILDDLKQKKGVKINS